MVFEAHCISSPYRTLIIQLCQDKDSFPFYGTFKAFNSHQKSRRAHAIMQDTLHKISQLDSTKFARFVKLKVHKVIQRFV